MAKNKKRWHGVDTNNKTNLFEYGWLLRSIDNENEEYEIIFSNDDWYYKTTFVFRRLYELNHYRFNDLAENECMPLEEFAWTAAHNVVFLVEALSSLYGLTQIFGNCSLTLPKTEKEIRKQLTSAL